MSRRAVRIAFDILWATFFVITSPIWIAWIIITGAFYGLAYLMMTFGNIVCKWLTKLEGPTKQ